MTTVFIILAILWIIIPIAMKKKQQQSKADEERQRAARERAPQPAVQARPQQPMRTTPLTPSVRPVMQNSFEGFGSTEGTSTGSFEGEPAHDVTSNLTQVKSSLTEARSSITHTVTVSSESGHAHEETSASGIEADCPPGKTSIDLTVPSVQTNEGAYLWDVTQARAGLVMAEILGPCLALRD